MKKLMFAVAAMAAGIAVADITSSNIVGYSENGLRHGAKMITAQFVNIGASKNIDLQSLVPTGSGIIDQTEIKVLNAGGVGVEDYIWTSGSDVDSDTDCWANEDQDTKITDRAFEPGTGLWVYGEDGQGIRSSGEVEQVNDVVFPLRHGAIGCGNPYPVAINLQDIVPEGDGIIDQAEIKVLNAGGVGVEDYIWTAGSDVDSETDCWANEDQDTKITDRMIQPGEGLWVYGEDGQSLRFCNPFGE